LICANQLKTKRKERKKRKEKKRIITFWGVKIIMSCGSQKPKDDYAKVSVNSFAVSNNVQNTDLADTKTAAKAHFIKSRVPPFCF
jgi:hypothetical protein